MALTHLLGLILTGLIGYIIMATINESEDRASRIVILMVMSLGVYLLI